MFAGISDAATSHTIGPGRRGAAWVAPTPARMSSLSRDATHGHVAAMAWGTVRHGNSVDTAVADGSTTDRRADGWDFSDRTPDQTCGIVRMQDQVSTAGDGAICDARIGTFTQQRVVRHATVAPHARGVHGAGPHIGFVG